MISKWWKTNRFCSCNSWGNMRFCEECQESTYALSPFQWLNWRCMPDRHTHESPLCRVSGSACASPCDCHMGHPPPRESPLLWPAWWEAGCSGQGQWKCWSGHGLLPTVVFPFLFSNFSDSISLCHVRERTVSEASQGRPHCTWNGLAPRGGFPVSLPSVTSSDSSPRSPVTTMTLTV